MPIPILFAVAAALFSGAGTSILVAAYKDDKFNKAQKEWQDERKKLQERLAEYQCLLREREETIRILTNQLQEVHAKWVDSARELAETDAMMTILEEKQRKLETILQCVLAFVLFKYKNHKEKIQQNLTVLADSSRRKSILSSDIIKLSNQYQLINQEKSNLEAQKNYYEGEIYAIDSLIEDNDRTIEGSA
jgi:chromosome segregation ATPase